jgi:MscS family membrane protein
MRLRYEKTKKLNKTIIFFATFIVAILTIIYLANKGYIFIPSYITNVLNFFLLFSITFSIISIILKFTSNRFYKSLEKDLEIEQRIFLTKIYSLIWYIFGISFLLYELGLELKDITIVLGLATTGLAFALRDLILSFFVWLIVLSKKPFRHQDIILIGEELGRVDRIGVFYITLKDSNNDILKIPNKTFLEKATKNYGSKKIIITSKFPLNTYLAKKDLDKIKNFFSKKYDLNLEQLYEAKDIFLIFKIKTEFDKIDDIKEDVFIKVTQNFSNLILQTKKD